jgi:hypothetical protein
MSAFAAARDQRSILLMPAALSAAMPKKESNARRKFSKIFENIIVADITNVANFPAIVKKCASTFSGIFLLHHSNRA